MGSGVHSVAILLLDPYRLHPHPKAVLLECGSEVHGAVAVVLVDRVPRRGDLMLERLERGDVEHPKLVFVALQHTDRARTDRTRARGNPPPV